MPNCLSTLGMIWIEWLCFCFSYVLIRFMPTLKGRGATNNQTSIRFKLTQSEEDGDWLAEKEQIDGLGPRLRTTVTLMKPKTIITRNSSPDIPFTMSINGSRVATNCVEVV